MNIKDIQCKDKVVFVRVDFNVPMTGGKISNTNRIDSTLPTINLLVQRGAKIVLCSHLGRPKGEPNKEFSLYPVYLYLKNQCAYDVLWADKATGEEAESIKRSLKAGQILLLENVRFYAKEESNDPDFAKKLAQDVDIFVDEAFAVSHRKSASNFGMSRLLTTFYGLQYEKEIKNLDLSDKAKPILAILGGAKVQDKIGLIDKLIDKVQEIYIGGAMAFTFLKSQGYQVGQSLVDDSKLSLCAELIKKAKTKGVSLHLPQDVVVSQSAQEPLDVREVDISHISSRDIGCDIGSKSIEDLEKIIQKSGTIFWNGPLGIYTIKNFANATNKISLALCDTKAYTIIGGGDTVDAMQKCADTQKIDFVSTGGGASLYYLQNN